MCWFRLLFLLVLYGHRLHLISIIQQVIRLILMIVESQLIVLHLIYIVSNESIIQNDLLGDPLLEWTDVHTNFQLFSYQI